MQRLKKQKVRFRFNLIIISLFSIGIFVAVYIATSNIIPNIFATSQTSLTYSTETQFNTGIMSSTQASGSGNSAEVQLSGNSGPDGTKYVRAITINNTNNPNTLTNYQISFSLDTASLISAGKLQSNCADLRFRDSDNYTDITNYWVYNCNSSSSIIWVKVPSIPASSNKTIYLYYGSPSASAQSSGTNTFDFFDDFENYASTADMINGGWNDGSINGASISLDPTGGYNNTKGLFLNPNGGVGWQIPVAYSTSTFTPGHALEFYYKTGDMNFFAGSEMGFSDATVANGTPDSGGNNFVGFTQNTSGQFFTTKANGADTSNSMSNITMTNWNLYSVRWLNNNAQFYVNGSIVGSNNSNVPSVNLRLRFINFPANTDSSQQGMVDDIYVRNYSSPDPSISVGNESITVPPSGTWESASQGSNTIDLIWNGGWGDGSNDTSTAFSATVASVNTNQTITFEMKTATSEANLSTSPYITLGTVNSGTTFTTTAAQMNSLGVSTGDYRYLQVEAIFSQSTGVSPQLDNFTIYYTKDNTPPETNASSILMYTSNGGRSISQSGWDNSSTPYFSWTAGSDSQSGMKGYCLYLGTSNSTIPSTSSSGNLNPNNSPISASGTGCEGGNGFITSSTSIDLSTSGYLQTQLTTSTSPYYLGVAAVDNEGNIDSNFVYFTFYFDNTIPNNVSYTSCPGGNFSNVTNMSFSWPTSGSNASSSIAAPILGWQYQINSTSGTWNGPNYNSSLSVNYIPSTNSSYTLTSSDSSSIIVGDNIIYFRTIDEAGNISSYRTCSIAYGGQAPIFPIGGQVLVTPNTSNTNTFSLSWPSATATTGQTVADYYYMVNNTPPSSLATLQENGGKYINNGTSTEVSATVLSNAVKGTNTVYVVAIDNSATPNYSPSNYISGTFTLNSNNPDPVSNLVATDSSIKVKSQWNVTLTWSAPSYQGAGNLTYLIYRSTNDVNFTEVGTTIGLSYVDNTPESTLYYYYIITQDGASELSDQSTTVSITPTGRYTSPASIETTPTVTNITDNSATISWSTDRNSDSKIEYGKSSGNYYTTEPYVPTQVTEHVVTLTNLSPSTTYYYKAIWTDSDGNTGTSTESTFTTNPPPEVSDVSVSNITLNSAYISFSISNAVVAQIQYGPTTSFGGSISLTTSPNKSPYTEPITGLSSGTQYYYRIAMTDPTGNIYYSDTYNNLITPPTPEISKIEISAVSNSPEIDVFVQWSTNTATSSVISYGGKTQVDENFISGEHQAIITNLSSNTKYSLTIKVIDKYGNQVTSSPQIFTTGINKVPPKIVSLNIQTQLMKSSSGNTQIIVSWTTDKPSTSQVEYGEGTGTTYSQKSTEDNHYVINHVVVISNLPTARIYHIKAISVDSNGNVGYSSDNITITPQATESALNLVLGNLEQVFGFLGNLNVSY